MKLVDLLSKANKYYPDGFLAEYYDSDGNIVDGQGDTLAEFIVKELKDTFDPDASDEDQIREAIRAMETAKRDICAVLAGLNDSERRNNT
jgi:hypothetical protein